MVGHEDRRPGYGDSFRVTDLEALKEEAQTRFDEDTNTAIERMESIFFEAHNILSKDRSIANFALKIWNAFALGIAASGLIELGLDGLMQKAVG